MAMGLVWTLMVTAALVCGAVRGMLPAVTAAAMKGVYEEGTGTDVLSREYATHGRESSHELDY